jgi:hypothetical protein
LSSISPDVSSDSLISPSMPGQSVPDGFFEMGLETLREIAIGRLVDHLRQRLGDLLLGIIYVLQPMQQQIVHRLDVL